MFTPTARRVNLSRGQPNPSAKPPLKMRWPSRARVRPSVLERLRRRDRRAVIAAYEAMLGRRPESEEVIEAFSRVGIEQAVRSIAESPEFQARRQTSPFFHYSAS